MEHEYFDRQYSLILAHNSSECLFYIFKELGVNFVTALFNFFQDQNFLILGSRQNFDIEEATAMYPDWVYESMETDEVRNSAYRQVIAKAVRGKTVLELGTGRKALWARYAAGQGARKVYAIEANPKSCRRSKELVRRLGIENIEIIQGFSHQVELPERCEVLVHDLIGAIGSAEGMVPFLKDARRRFLSPDAIQFPLACQTLYFPSEIPKETFLERSFNFCFSRGGKRLDTLQMIYMFGYRKEAQLAPPEMFEDLSLVDELPEEESRVAEFRIQKDGICDGFVFFIRLFVDSDHIVDSLATRTNWYLPFVRPFPKPIPVRKGEVMRVESQASYRETNPLYRLRCHYGGESHEFTWTGV